MFRASVFQFISNLSNIHAGNYNLDMDIMAESKEELFFEALNKQINLELDKSYDPKDRDQRDYLGLSENAVALAQTGILLSGLASAAFTFGLSVAVAGSIVVIIKAGKICFELYQDTKPTSTLQQNLLADPKVLVHQRNLRRLAIYLNLRQAGAIVFLRYYYGLHQIVLDDKNIKKFVQVCVARMMKKLCTELAKDPLKLPNPEDLADFLLSSIHRSGLITTEEIALKPTPNSSLMRLAAMPVEEDVKKYLSLQCWLSFDATDVKVLGTEESYLKSLWDAKSTRHDYGYISIARGKEHSIPVMAIDKSKLKELRLTPNEKTNIIQKSLFQHYVTVQDISDYEQDYQTNPIKQTFNQFISVKYNRPSKAHIQGEIRNLKLAGDYSNVDFYGCHLIDCDASNGCFFNAKLTRSILIRLITNAATNLQYINAEGSIWDGEVPVGKDPIVILADISHGNFSGSTWKHYKISTSASQIGSIWLWATLDPNMLTDQQASIFEQRLTNEHNAREEQAKRIDTLEQQFKTVENLIRTNDKQANIAIADLRTNIADLQTEIGTVQQIQLVAITQQLATLSSDQKTNTQALAKMTARLDQCMQQQNQHNQIVDTQLAQLQARQDVFYQSSLYCTYWVYTDDYRAKKSTYIPLYVKSSRNSISDPPILLNDALHQERRNKTKYVLIHAPSSAGQTFGVTAYGESVNAIHTGPDSTTFLTINAAKIRDKEPNILTTLLSDNVYKNAELSVLDEMKKYSFVIHLSKLDASGIPPAKLIKDCESFSEDWPDVTFFFSGRSAYMQAVRTYLEAKAPVMPGIYSDYAIQHLKEEQIQDFLNLFSRHKLATPCAVLQERGIINIPSLARTPLMLTIMVGVLFNHSANRVNEHMQEIDFYEASWHALYERIQFRLPDQYQNDEPAFMQQMYEFAKLMLNNNTDFIIYQRTANPPSTQKERILHEILETKMGTCSPLSITEIGTNKFKVSFNHETLGYYLMAKILINNLFEPSFKNDTFEQTWNKHYLTKTPGILQFLVQLLQKYPETAPQQPAIRMLNQNSYDELEVDGEQNDDDEAIPTQDKKTIEQRLLDMTFLTHKSNPNKEANKIAASNALTVLCKWGRNLFGQDFSQRILHHVDATNGLLSYTNNEGTDYTGSCFYNAMLFSAKFSKTNLKDTRFLNSTHFFEMGHSAHTFFVYPSLTETILFYPVPPDSNCNMHQIAMVRIIDGSTQLLRHWPAQEQAITTIDITNHGNEIRIASAGIGGTTHVWPLHPDNQIIPKEIATLGSLKYKSPINVVIWGPGGDILATGDQKGHVRTWNVTTKSRLLKSAKHSAAICAMVWNKTGDLLIAADGSSSLSVWAKASTLNGKELQLPSWPIRVTDESSELSIRSLVLSSDKTRLAIGCADGRIVILGCTTQAIELVLNQHKNSITSMVWYQHLISASRDRTVRIWPSEIHNGTVFEHDHAVGKVDVLPNGHIVSGVDLECTRIYFWDQKPFNSNLNPDPLGIISCMVANPSETNPCVAVGDAEGTVIVYPIQDMSQPDAPKPNIIVRRLSGSVQFLSWSWNGQYLAAIIQDRTLFLKDIQQPSKPAVIHQQPNDSSILFMHMAWLQNTDMHHQLFIGYSDGSIISYRDQNNFATPTPEISSPHLDAPIRFLASHKNSPYLAVANGQKINLIDPATQTVISQVSPNQQISKILQWSPDGVSLASLDETHHLSLWSVSNNILTPYATYYDSTMEIRCLLWADKWLIVGLANSREILYWNLEEQSINDAPKRIPFRARFLSESPHNENILVGRTTGIFFFNAPILNLDPSDANIRFKLQRLKAGVCAEGSDLYGAQNVSVSTQNYLIVNGAKNMGTRALFRKASFDASTSSNNLSAIPPLASDEDKERLVSAMPKSTLRILSVFADSQMTTDNPIPPPVNNIEYS